MSSQALDTENMKDNLIDVTLPPEFLQNLNGLAPQNQATLNFWDRNRNFEIRLHRQENDCINLKIKQCGVAAAASTGYVVHDSIDDTESADRAQELVSSLTASGNLVTVSEDQSKPTVDLVTETGDHLNMTLDHDTPTEENVTVTEDNDKAAESNVTPTKDNVTVTGDLVTTTGGLMPEDEYPSNELSLTSENESGSGDLSSVKKYRKNARKRSLREKSPGSRKKQTRHQTYSPGEVDIFSHKCTECTKKFRDETALQHHLSSKHNIKKEEDVSSPSSSPPEGAMSSPISEDPEATFKKPSQNSKKLYHQSLKQNTKVNENVVNCSICHFNFLNSKVLLDHLENHKDHSEYAESYEKVSNDCEKEACQMCNYTCKDKQLLENHQTVIHGNSNTTMADLSVMMNSPFKCKLCTSGSEAGNCDNWLELNQHVAQQHLTQGNKNDDNSDSEMKTMNEYMSELTKCAESERLIHQCIFCKTVAGTNRHLKGHVEKCHRKDQRYIDYIQENIYNKNAAKLIGYSTLQPIIPSVGNYVCRYCSMKYKTGNSLMAHVQKDHSTAEGIDEYIVELKEELKITCHICNKVIANKYQLRIHIKNKHSEDQKLRCDECGKLCKNKLNLDAHKRASHRQDKPICDTCGKSFSSRDNLKVHVANVHQELEMAICDICKKEVRKRNLAKHKARHEASPKYKCDYCGREQLDKANAQRHYVLMHSRHDIKFEICEECGKKFTSKNNLKQHRQVVHGIGLYQCKHCSQNFCKLTQYRNHMKGVHRLKLTDLEAAPRIVNLQEGKPKETDIDRSMIPISVEPQPEQDIQVHDHSITNQYVQLRVEPDSDEGQAVQLLSADDQGNQDFYQILPLEGEENMFIAVDEAGNPVYPAQQYVMNQ
ncbi:unnamed protein product [Owenia fusiformis]|uniref:Uncharacterized protein n=1 Tax=Owenia fusiformis TaxID=6347 RepID=A0A8J1XNW3_OWEFU|nr:unnamed protein product [Owenia fusiformis]